jgi:hypothetical protein
MGNSLYIDEKPPARDISHTTENRKRLPRQENVLNMIINKVDFPEKVSNGIVAQFKFHQIFRCLRQICKKFYQFTESFLTNPDTQFLLAPNTDPFELTKAPNHEYLVTRVILPSYMYPVLEHLPKLQIMSIEGRFPEEYIPRITHALFTIDTIRMFYEKKIELPKLHFLTLFYPKIINDLDVSRRIYEPRVYLWIDDNLIHQIMTIAPNLKDLFIYGFRISNVDFTKYSLRSISFNYNLSIVYSLEDDYPHIKLPPSLENFSMNVPLTEPTIDWNSINPGISAKM